MKRLVRSRERKSCFIQGSENEDDFPELEIDDSDSFLDELEAL